MLKWVKITQSIGTPPMARHGHRGVAVDELIIFFFGGNNGIVQEVCVYDTQKNHFFHPKMKGQIPEGRAAFGIVVDNNRVLIHGGLKEHWYFSDKVYELEISSWCWKKLNPRLPQNATVKLGRMGHTFTIIEKQIFMFGGLTSFNQSGILDSTFSYLNDLYTLDISLEDSEFWDVPITLGRPPPERESHSAVAHVGPEGLHRLIIYGGMNGSRLNDVWMLLINNRSMTWIEILTSGPRPLPRSLHSATLIDDKMYVFGGCVPRSLNSENSPVNVKTTSQLACLDLVNFTWKVFANKNFKVPPQPRAGHCAVELNKKIYIWSGRTRIDPYNRQQRCYNVFGYIDLNKPSAPGCPILFNTGLTCLQLQWNPVEEDYFLLQIMKTQIDV